MTVRVKLLLNDVCPSDLIIAVSISIRTVFNKLKGGIEG